MDNKVVQNDTCFAAHARYGVACKEKKCRNWIDHEKCQNCVLVASSNGSLTLQQIGDIFNLTRMRICQIEKGIYGKISLPILQATEYQS